jgi:hypothetical protein
VFNCIDRFLLTSPGIAKNKWIPFRIPVFHEKLTQQKTVKKTCILATWNGFFFFVLKTLFSQIYNITIYSIIAILPILQYTYNKEIF